MEHHHEMSAHRRREKNHACRRTQRQFDCAPESEGASKAAEDWQHNLIMHQHPLGLSASASRYHPLALLHLLVLCLVLDIKFSDHNKTGTVCCDYQLLALSLLVDAMLIMQCKSHTACTRAANNLTWLHGTCTSSCNKPGCYSAGAQS